MWVLMITAAENEGWPGDVAISASDVTGLPIPSIVRTAKIATVQAGDATKIGRCTPAAWRKVEAELKRAGLK